VVHGDLEAKRTHAAVPGAAVSDVKRPLCDRFRSGAAKT
jgi:hypothetical protein